MKELDRETVRQVLYNFISNSEDLDEDETVQALSHILSDSLELISGEAQRSIQGILEDEVYQIQLNSVDECGSLDRPQALERCLDPDWGLGDFVARLIGGLEKTGKLTFQDTHMKTFLTDPEKPFSTYRQVKEVFNTFSEFVWWLDKQFGAEGFLYLLDLDARKVHEIRLLSGPVNVNDRFKKNYLRAKKEFEGQGVNLQARVILERGLLQEIHDRYLVEEKATYTLPPVNILTDKQATISRLSQDMATQIQSAFNKYWQNSVDPLAGDNWTQIQGIRDKLNEGPGGGL